MIKLSYYNIKLVTKQIKNKFQMSYIITVIWMRLSIENKAKLSRLKTPNTSSALLFIYNLKLRGFRFVLYG